MHPNDEKTDAMLPLDFARVMRTWRVGKGQRSK